MRRIFRFLLFFFLCLLLIAGLGVATFPWWGPGVLERVTANVLRSNGFAEADVSVEAMGLSQMSLAVERLRYQGARVTDGGLRLRYDFNGLRNSELEQVRISNPRIDVDFSHEWPAAKGQHEREEPSMPWQLPRRFPINQINLDGAVLTLRGRDWERTLELDVGLAGREHVVGEATVQGGGVQLDAQTDVDWPELSGRATVSAIVNDLTEWTEFCRERGLFSLPEGLGLRTEPLEIQAGAEFSEQTLRDWNVELISQGVTATMETAAVSVGQVELKLLGDATELGHLDLQISEGTTRHEDLDLSFDQLLASASSAEQFDLNLTGWELSGETDLGGLGTVSSSAGDVALSVDGAWQAWLPNFDPANLGLRMRVANAPLSLITGLGSISGSWQMDAELSAGQVRTFSLSTELLEGAVTAAAASLNSERLSVSVQGSLPDLVETGGGRKNDAPGNGVEVAHFDLEVSKGRTGHKALDLSFDQLLASASSVEQFDLRLSGWELDGETDLGGLGMVSTSAGDVALSVDGAWQAWLSNFDPVNLGLRMRVAKAPLSLFTGLGSVSGSWEMDAELSAGQARTFSLSTELLDGAVTAAAGSLDSDRLSLSVHGILPDSLGAVLGVNNGRVTWAEGGGLLTGLEGDFELASLQPIASKGWQSLRFAAVEQGEFTTGPGELRLSYVDERNEAAPLQLEITTTALGGKVRVLVEGRVRDALALSIRVLLDSVQLEEIAQLFPQFEGRIEGVASGELALRLDGTQIALLPGGIRLAAGRTGRFEYLRKGWLTQDPRLDPEIFVNERDILQTMKDPQGAQVLTEFALRNLNMSAFSLRIDESPSGAQSIVAEIKGSRIAKGVTVPVVLNVPIRGDVKETINAVFEFNARM